MPVDLGLKAFCHRNNVKKEREAVEASLFNFGLFIISSL